MSCRTGSSTTASAVARGRRGLLCDGDGEPAFLDALRLLAKRAGMEFPEGDLDESSCRKRNRLLNLNKEAARFFHSQLHSPVGQPGLDYLQRRGGCPRGS